MVPTNWHSNIVFHHLVKMNNLLILLATLTFVACLGSPVEYQREAFETGRNSNTQVTQNPIPEELKANREHYQGSRTNNQPTRQEYRRYGKDALSQSSQVDTSATGFNTNERKTTQNQNSEIQTTFPIGSQVSQFPSASEGTQVQKSSFRNQDQGSDSLFAYTPVSRIQPSFSNQETLRPGAENAEDHVPGTSGFSQGHSQKGTPFGMERRPESQSGMYENNFGSSFPGAQDPVSQTEEAAFQNQNNFRSPIDDQRFQSQQTYYQNVGRGDHRSNQGDHRSNQGDHRSNQGQQMFSQRAAQDTQDQIPSTQRSQEQVNQFPKASQQNERSSVPVSSYDRDNFFNQGQISFDSRRISPGAPVSQPLEHASGDDNKFFSSSTLFPRNQQNEKSQNRQISGIKNGIHFEDNKPSQSDNRKQSAGNIHDDRQGLFQSIEQNQPVLTVSTVQQTSTPVLVSGTKGSPAIPVMVYKTGSAASPHAVVLGRDLNVINKASVSQHLQTPFTQYTYTHPL